MSVDRARAVDAFVRAWWPWPERPLDPANLFGPGRLEGDDGDEFLLAFAEAFDVDVHDFRSYMHYDADEPPGNRRLIAYGEDGAGIPLIPVSIADLVDAADAGRWNMTYPVHRLRISWRRRLIRLGYGVLLGATLLILLLMWGPK